MQDRWLLLAGILGFVSVAGGAFGAHALEAHRSVDLMATFDTGTHYAQVHVVALLCAAILGGQRGGRAWSVACGGFALGILIFAGSLWTLVLTEQRWLGAVTPLGGLSLLVGWVSVGVGATRPPAR